MNALALALSLALAAPSAGPSAVPWGPLPGVGGGVNSGTGPSEPVPGNTSTPASTPAPLASATPPPSAPPPSAPPPSAPPPPPRASAGGWRRIATPIFSAMTPGVGQMVNRQPARGAGFLLGSLALAAGAVALLRTQGGLDAAAPGEHGRTFSTEVVTAAGFGLLTGGLHLLYMAQIMDAYAGAVGKRAPRAHTGHRVSLELTRMASVGLRAGDPAAAFYADWNLSVLGQVARRVSLGVGDLGLKFGLHRAAVQGGPRVHVRFLERDRVWLGAAAGAILQGAFASGGQPALLEGEAAPRTASFALIPYGQLDLRLFILDRWSLNIVPRISAPLVGARYYRGDGAIPRQAATLELGTGLGVYF